MIAIVQTTIHFQIKLLEVELKTTYLYNYISLKFVSKGLVNINNNPALIMLIQTMACHQTVTSHYLKFRINDSIISQIAKFMGPAWGPPGSYRPQLGPMLAPWTLPSGLLMHMCHPASVLEHFWVHAIIHSMVMLCISHTILYHTLPSWTSLQQIGPVMSLSITVWWAAQG